MPKSGYTVKVDPFCRPQPGCHLPNSPWPGIIKLFPVRESLVSDIPAGDGKNDNLFYSVSSLSHLASKDKFEPTKGEFLRQFSGFIPKTLFRSRGRTLRESMGSEKGT